MSTESVAGFCPEPGIVKYIALPLFLIADEDHNGGGVFRYSAWGGGDISVSRDGIQQLLPCNGS